MRGTTWRHNDRRKGYTGELSSTGGASIHGVDGAGSDDRPLRPKFLDWTRRVSEASWWLGQTHGASDANTGNLEAEMKRFKDVESHYEDTKGQVDAYISSIHCLIKCDAWLGTTMTEALMEGETPILPSPKPSPILPPSLTATHGSQVFHKQAGGDLIHATLLLSFEEFFTQPLRDAARHIEDLRRENKRRQALVVDYEHQKRKAESAGDHHKPPSSDYERAAALVKEASVGLKLRMIAFIEAYSQLIQSISQCQGACQIFYHRGQLSRIEDAPLDQGLRQVLESTVEVLHPEVGRYLSWMKSIAFVLEQNLDPKELGGCVTPFDMLVSTMADALKPKPGLFFGKPLASFEDVPSIVLACTRYLDRHGMYTEGIFRVPGNMERVNALKARFDQGQGDEDLLMMDDEDDNGVTVHDVATLYKLYFREGLSSPLVPSSFLRLLLDARSLPTPEFVATVRDAVAAFPCPHAKTLRVLLALLYRINLCAEFNKMNSKNLGVCFAPTVLRAGDREELGLSDIQPSIVLITMLIDVAPDLFPNLWEDYPVQEQQQQPQPSQQQQGEEGDEEGERPEEEDAAGRDDVVVDEHQDEGEDGRDDAYGSAGEDNRRGRDT